MHASKGGRMGNFGVWGIRKILVRVRKGVGLGLGIGLGIG